MPNLRVAFTITCTVIACTCVHPLLAQNLANGCWKPSGTSATLIVSMDPADSSLEGMVVSVHSSAGQCSDAAILRSGRAALTAWGDDPKTDEIDGFRHGEAFEFRIQSADGNRTDLAGAEIMHPSFQKDAEYLSRETGFVPGGIYHVILSRDLAANKAGRAQLDSTSATAGRDPVSIPSADSIAALSSHSPEDGTPLIEPGTPILKTELLSIYPNPASQSAHIEFAVAAGSTASLHIYDILGRRIPHNLASRSFTTGRYRIQEDLSGLASGVYVLRLTTGRSVFDRLLHVVQSR